MVAINRAIALSHTRGERGALDALDALSGDSRLGDYQPYWAARAQILERIGDAAAADRAYERAIGLEADAAVREFLPQRRLALGPPAGACSRDPAQ